MNIIVFSKNRAGQLELFLRSIKKYFKDIEKFQIKILYLYTDEFFEKGYTKLIGMYKDLNILWVKEENFKIDLNILLDVSKKHTIFFVDDDVFKEPFSIEDKEFKIFEKNNDILCLSLRLHPNLTYCYTANVKQIKPVFDENNVFDWRGRTGDYGYPMSLEAHFFRTKDIIYYIRYINYNGPNPLESNMASQPLNMPKMICYKKSITMNVPVNKVQNWNNNLHGNISAEYINEQFLSGKIIDLSTFDGFENISCHQEVCLNFV